MQLQPITAGQQGAAPDPKASAKLVRAASEFEALLIAQMLRSARESAAADSDDDQDDANSSLKELSEQQFAQALANSGGLGIANIVVAGISKNENR